MEVKSSLFERSLITKTERYITDRVILLSLEYPQIIYCLKIKVGEDRMESLDDNDIKERIIPDKKDIRDITELFKHSVAIYERDYAYQKIFIKDCAIKIQLKFYDFIVQLTNTYKTVNLYVNNNNDCLYLFSGDNFLGAIMAIKE